MSRYGRYETKVYVGNLGTGAGKGELERAFSYYGPLRTVWIARNPPGFAFVEFEDPRDAEDAVLGLDGKIICGSRIPFKIQRKKVFSLTQPKSWQEIQVSFLSQIPVILSS
ncbi:hypothetical protein Y1Q_0008512 [Alligator mississippiensis]|uniref:RRM domain-containing protein n=1 Tax=Alligator mississippiensis TaxID=8496 RepID=A0A151M1K1_ALLMI|nr:hypothetical protein Y1Q_0008512 [Alligator mississippiensis]